MFDIAPRVVQQFTGYKHDEVIPELDGRFEVLESTGPTKKSWVSRLFGGKG